MAQPSCSQEFHKNEFHKNVLLLKHGDFQWRNGLPCHPTNIDMSKIKKTQRKKVVFVKEMSQQMVESRLQEIFPYLKNKRFFCAAVVKVNDDSKRFELHGSQPSLWDGRTIKAKITGNSSLYILEYEVLQAASTDTPTPSTSAQWHSLISSPLESRQTCFHQSLYDVILPECLGESPMELDNNQHGLQTASCASTSGESHPPEPSFVDDWMGAMSDQQVSDSIDSLEEDISSLRGLSTSGISEGDLDWSEEVQPQDQWIHGNVKFEVSIKPRRVPLQGAEYCRFTLNRKLPSGVLSGIAEFQFLESIEVNKFRDDSMIGEKIPPSPEPGLVTVILKAHYNGLIIKLGETKILYVDEEEEFLERVVQEQDLQERFFSKMALRLRGNSASRRSDSKTFGNLGSQLVNDCSGSTQALHVLQLLVYKAAETGAQQFIELIFTSSAGRVVFGTYKDSPLLPEVIARRCRHEKAALYLEDVTRRFSKDIEICPEGCQAIDWLELVAAAKAAKRQLSDDKEEETNEVNNEVITDTDYFGDGETSSSDSAVLSTSDSEDGISEMSLKEVKKEAGSRLNDTQVQPVSAPGYQSSTLNVVFARKEWQTVGARRGSHSFMVENCLLQLKEAQNLQEVTRLYHPAVSVLWIIDNGKLPRHLNTAQEKWRSALALQERITHRPSISFRKLNVNPTVMVEGSLLEDNFDRKLSIIEPQQHHHTPQHRDVESLYKWLAADDGFPSPNDGDQSVGWKSSDYSTEQCNSNVSEFWVLTCVFRPTMKTLFLYAADVRDALPHQSWIQDEDCELLTRSWKWQRCGKNSLEFTARETQMKHPAGLQKSELQLSSMDALIAYVLGDEKPVTQYKRGQYPRWVFAMMHHCWTHLPAEESPAVAIFDNFSRDFVSSWVITSELRNDGKAKRPTLNICHPDDTSHFTSMGKQLQKEETDLKYLEDFRNCYREAQEEQSEKFRPNVEDLPRAVFSGDQEPQSTHTININSTSPKDFREHHLNDAETTPLTTLHLTINSSEMSRGSWADDLAYSLAKSTSLTTLLLTINNRKMSEGSWADDLAYSLAKSTSLTTLHLTINSCEMSGGSWAHHLARGLAKSTSLTTLHFTINNNKISGGFWAHHLAYGLAKSTSLTTLHVTINNNKMSGGSGAHHLAYGLAESTSLTTLHVTINNNKMSGGSWAHHLAYGLAESTSLTMLHVTINDNKMSGGSWAHHLAHGLAESTSLTTLHVTINSSEMSGDDWVHHLAYGLTESTSLTAIHLTINVRFFSKAAEEELAYTLCNSSKSFTELSLKVNDRDVLNGRSGLRDLYNSSKRTLSTRHTLPFNKLICKKRIPVIKPRDTFHDTASSDEERNTLSTAHGLLCTGSLIFGPVMPWISTGSHKIGDNVECPLPPTKPIFKNRSDSLGNNSF